MSHGHFKHDTVTRLYGRPRPIPAGPGRYDRRFTEQGFAPSPHVGGLRGRGGPAVQSRQSETPAAGSCMIYAPLHFSVNRNVSERRFSIQLPQLCAALPPLRGNERHPAQADRSVTACRRGGIEHKKTRICGPGFFSSAPEKVRASS